MGARLDVEEFTASLARQARAHGVEMTADQASAIARNLAVVILELQAQAADKDAGRAR